MVEYKKSYQMLRVMKFLSLLILLFLSSCGNSENSNSDNITKKETGQANLAYQKGDLKKIKWIEGKWKGMYNGQPFYEIYQLVNDSTLVVTSFDWNGKDSSNTSKTYLGWFDDAHYLGNEKNYKVTTITDSQIFMTPNNKASNSVLWKYGNDSSWEAILEGPKATQKYLMERFDPFSGSATKP